MPIGFPSTPSVLEDPRLGDNFYFENYDAAQRLAQIINRSKLNIEAIVLDSPDPTCTVHVRGLHNLTPQENYLITDIISSTGGSLTKALLIDSF